MAIIVVVQGLMEVAGVASIFPFLALATNPEEFRNSWFGQFLLETLPPMDDSSLLFTAGIASLLVLLLSNGLRLFSDYAKASYGQGFGHWLRVRMLEEMVTQPWSFFLENNTGVLLKKIAGDVMMFVNQVLLAILEGFSRLVSVVFLVAMILFIDAKVALSAGALVLVFYVLVFRVLGRLRRRLSDQAKDGLRGAMKEGQQVLGGIKPIKVSLREGYFLERYGRFSQVLCHVGVRLPLVQHGPKYLLEPMAFGGLIAFVLLSVAQGKNLVTLAPLLGVIGFAAYRLLPAAQLLYAQVSQVSNYRHALEEIHEEFNRTPVFLSYERLPVRKRLLQRETLAWRNEIRLEQLSFVYPEAEKPVISNLSLQIPRNAAVGIIGPTGSGKSTLVDLILGLHRPTGGQILVDGTEISPQNVREWQAGIGYVPQDVFLIDDSIARNIAFGLDDEEIDQAQLREAAEAAQILEFIEGDLSAGFETVVGERGVRLSGGQRQRLALARALYGSPSLLVLDEATSALDNETEAVVMSAIRRLQGSITMIIVAHRLSTIEECSTVLRLDRGVGRLVELADESIGTTNNDGVNVTDAKETR
ncbi:MAG: ABC transporter ATP-binding protein [Verrucomicrobiota bacterium]